METIQASSSVGHLRRLHKSDPSGVEPRDIYVTLSGEGKTLVVDKDTLSNFVPGKAKLAVEVSASSQVPDNGTKGGVLSYTIVSRPISVNVLK